jgi:pyruvate dehydrogenase E2 component (dihydrolipoamide acetyltransferase)
LSKTIEIRVPDIGDFKDIPVIEVLVREGDRVQAEAGLVTLESDKATMEVPTPAAGTIREFRLKLGDAVSQGDLVAILEVEEAAAGEAPAAAAQNREIERPRAAAQAPDGAPAAAAGAIPATALAGSGTEAAPPRPAAPASGQQDPESGLEAAAGAAVETVDADRAGERLSGPAAVDPSAVPYASPAVRRFARELGVDLGRVSGSGDKGRILRDDLIGHVKAVMAAMPVAPAPGQVTAIGGLKLDFPAAPDVDFTRFGEIERQPLSRIQKISAGHLHRNWVGIPHVTQHDEADITDMEAFRAANAEEALARGFKLTPLVFLIKAVVASLTEFPRFNASLDKDGETLVLKRYYNIGIAVDTPDGLVVPVIRQCERKGIMELAAELAEVSARARDRKLTPQDIQGGSISISSLGGIGGTAFTPIINAPEVAVLGVSRSRMQPLWDGSGFKPRLMLPLSLSYDHRVIDGAAAARFTRFLASRLEDLRRLTL